MSCVVAGLRYYFRIYKYEYLGELMTSKLHIIAKPKAAIQSFIQIKAVVALDNTAV